VSQSIYDARPSSGLVIDWPALCKRLRRQRLGKSDQIRRTNDPSAPENRGLARDIQQVSTRGLQVDTMKKRPARLFR